MRFLGIILRLLRLEVSIYDVNIAIQFQATFARGGGGGVGYNPLEVTVNGKEENSYYFFCPDYVQEFGFCTKNFPSPLKI
jgi:hypothetical protein